MRLKIKASRGNTKVAEDIVGAEGKTSVSNKAGTEAYAHYLGEDLTEPGANDAVRPGDAFQA